MLLCYNDIMETLPKNIWKRLASFFPADKESAGIAAQLFRDYEAHGCLNKSGSELLQYKLPVIVDFFCRIALMHSYESPVLRRRDTRWMSEFDYTLVNIRGAGVGRKMGNFLSASFYLATLRTRGIIISPVTQGPSENLELMESHAVIRRELADADALDAGMGPEVQMLAFCEAAHLLGLVTGYELDYRVDPLAAVVLHKPELFLWTQHGQFIPDEEKQEEWREIVREQIALIKESGVGLNRNDIQTTLTNISIEPKLSSDGSKRVPLAFKKVNSHDLGETRDEAVAYWCRVFDLWRDRYGFDFLVLNGTRSYEGGQDEIPDLALMSRAAESARKSGVRRNIGVAAEGHPEEIEDYGLQGIDLVLVKDAECKADKGWFQRVFTLNDSLRQLNLGRKLKFSIPLALNPGEEDSLTERKRALIKRFVARFLGTGPSRRPLLETMGALEGAWGFHSSVKQAATLGWMPDHSYARRVHCLEDTALLFRNILNSGELVDRFINDQLVWWIISSKRGLLIAVVSFEYDSPDSLNSIDVDYSPYLKKPEKMTIIEYDFDDRRGILHLGSDIMRVTSTIPYMDVRLFAVTRIPPLYR